MKKKILTILISMAVMVSVTSVVMADPEETVAPETTIETVTETTATPETVETTPSDMIPESTEAPASSETVSETTVAEDTTPSFETVSETTDKATESTVSSDVDLYVTQSGDTVTKMEEEKKDPTLKIFFLGLILGLILGGVCGYFLASFLIKQKIGRQHDIIYESIRHGQTSLATQQRNEKKAAEREVELKKKKEEEALRKKQKEAQKKEKAEKKAEQKAEQERKRDEAKYLELQAKLQKSATPTVPDQTKIAMPEPEIKEEVSTVAAKEQNVEEVRPAAEPKVSEEEIVNFEDMIYQGEDAQGIPFYTDPNDPAQEPFNIIDGKKVFYD